MWRGPEYKIFVISLMVMWVVLIVLSFCSKEERRRGNMKEYISDILDR